MAALAVGLLIAKRWNRYRPVPEPSTNKFIARFLDVGQGDSELIQLPDNQNILIDSGEHGSPTVDLLKRYGVRTLNLVIATHPHSDHIGEMRDVMRSFKVDEFWDSGFNHPTKTYSDMLQEIHDRGIRYVTPKRGYSRQIGDATLDILNPGASFLDDQPNDASIVVLMTYRQTKFLFTGDAEVPAWKQMISEEKEKLHCDVLKAAHHGSSNGTTEEIIEAVGPTLLTISCGRGNDYHHPHPSVVRMLERQSSRINVYRTDLEGTVTATSDGERIEVSVERPVVGNQLYLTGDEVAGKLGSGSEQHVRPARARAAR